jgi:hypothetical protein
MFRRLRLRIRSAAYAGCLVAIPLLSGCSSDRHPTAVDPTSTSPNALLHAWSSLSPGTVTDLHATATGPSSVELTFTQVTDGLGSPADYDVRYAIAPISWASAASVTNGSCRTPLMGTAVGAEMTCSVLGLTPKTAYNFQLVAYRNTLNVDVRYGGLSNVAAATTPTDSTVVTSLAITTQPSPSASAGTPFTRQPILQLCDSFGVAVNRAGVTVTAALASASGSGTLLGTATATTNASGAAAFTNLAVSSAGTYTLGFSATGLPRATSAPVTVAAADSSTSDTTSTPSSEPAYSSATDKLILQDSFDSYTGITSGSLPFVKLYPSYRAVDTADRVVPLTNYVSLTTGRGNTGQAIRLAYGGGNGASDIIVGPEGRLGSVGSWNGSLPQVAGPYSHFYFSTWIRFSAGADPAGNTGGPCGDCGVKGVMLWYGSERYQSAPHRLEDYNGNRYPETRWDVGPPHPPNSVTKLNHWQTVDGAAPKFAPYADGSWHRFTQEIYAADPSGHQGERWWLDGVLMFDNVDNLGFNGATGTPPWGADYTYRNAVTHFMVFGNYVSGAQSKIEPFFTVDFDDWIAWTK